MKKSHSANDSEEFFREDGGGGDARDAWSVPRASSLLSSTHPFTPSGCRGPRGGRSRGQTDPLPRAPAPVVSVWGCTDSLEVWSHVHARCQRHLQGRGGLRFIRAPCDVRLCGSILQCCPWPPRPHSRTFCGVSLRVSQLCPSWTWLPRAHLWSGLPEPRPASSRQRPSLVNLHPRCCVPGVGLTVPKPGTTAGVMSVAGAVGSHCRVLRGGLTKSDLNIQNPSERSVWRVEDRAGRQTRWEVPVSSELVGREHVWCHRPQDHAGRLAQQELRARLPGE